MLEKHKIFHKKLKEENNLKNSTKKSKMQFYICVISILKYKLLLDLQKSLTTKTYFPCLPDGELSEELANDMMQRIRKRKCFADIELEELSKTPQTSSTALIQSHIIEKNNFKYQQEISEENNLLLEQSKNENPNTIITSSPNYLIDAINAFNVYYAQLANLASPNLFFLQASLNMISKNETFPNDQESSQAIFNFNNTNPIFNSHTFFNYLLAQNDSTSPLSRNSTTSEYSTESGRDEAIFDFDESDNSNKLTQLKLNENEKTPKESNASKAKSFSVESLLGVVR